MFKFRFGGQGGTSPTQPPSIETVRRRARHRLLGASLLVLAGVIGFPLLFESQPRPVQANFAIEIPSRKTAAPLSAAGNPAPAAGVRTDGLDEKEELVATAPAASAPPPVAKVPAPTQVPASAAKLPAPGPAPVSVPAPAAVPAQPGESAAAQPVPKPWEKQPAVADKKPAETKSAEAKHADKPVERKPAESKPAAKASDDAARALALLEGRPLQQDKPAADDKGAAKGRHIVQVGAFVDPALAQEARMKLERAGLTTYTQISNTPDGPRTRVRLGPFANRAEADKAAAKARALGMSAAILTL